ncbi:MAG: YdcF family protein [Synechococcales bacterium]|nr:YdcF family protein [Synechococcales bacterium]
MPEVITRLLLIALLIWLVWYVIKEIIPDKYLTILGGLVVVLFVVLAFQDPSDRFIGTLWQVISFPLKPLGLAIVLLIVSLREGLEKANGNLVLWALIVLLVFSLPLVAYWLTNQTQQSAEQIAALGDDGQIADVIVVVGEGLNTADPAYRSGTQFNNPDDGLGNTFVARLQYAGLLYQEQVSRGGAPLVLISPGPQIERDGNVLTGNIQAILAGTGVPADQVIVDLEGSDLHSSAEATRDILANYGLIERGYNLILVTSALKIRRARSAFAETLGILPNRIVPAPTDFYGFQVQSGDLLMRLTDIIPSVEALTLSTQVLEEYLAVVYYFVRGWLYDPLGA